MFCIRQLCSVNKEKAFHAATWHQLIKLLANSQTEVPALYANCRKV